MKIIDRSTARKYTFNLIKIVIKIGKFGKTKRKVCKGCMRLIYIPDYAENSWPRHGLETWSCLVHRNNDFAVEVMNFYNGFSFGPDDK